MKFEDFFQEATGGDSPYPYQRRFAQRDDLASLLSVPTGVGKTATVVLAWLWRRHQAVRSVAELTPRRLVYCLPMRTLVTQTENECRKWLSNAKLRPSVSVHVLMGGDDAGDWDEYPERDAILIGTQDMLLSRALNRGYGMSRYRWPIHFGLLNNDCWWVLDETQLMGVGLTTSVQMAGLRSKLTFYGQCRTTWMSATLDNDSLATVDHPKPSPDTDSVALDETDHANERVAMLLGAKKTLSPTELELSKDSSKTYAARLAELVVKEHQPKTLTLVVLNNVARAQDTFQEINSQFAAKDDSPDVHLIHSRFRPGDRQQAQGEALDESTIGINTHGRVVVTTQAIEAGVDISSTTLFSELAPWSSMVQRFGRCNRRGTCGRDGQPQANVRWIDIDTSDGKKSRYANPYDFEELDRSREQLRELTDVGPQSIASVSVPPPPRFEHVLRRKDLLDLFDTTPDLSGNDLDVSRYIRDSSDSDVQIYWRNWDLEAFRGHPPRLGVDQAIAAEDFPAAHRDELCSVPAWAAADFAGKLIKKKATAAFTWDPLVMEWRRVSNSDVRPGMILLTHVSAGGYDYKIGWTGDGKHQPEPIQPDSQERATFEAMFDDDTWGAEQPVELTKHLCIVAEEAAKLKAALSIDSIPWDAIILAARWHDVGKAHPAFQTVMRDCDKVAGQISGGTLLAKSGCRGMPRYRIEHPPHSRIGFRHELASALVWLAHNRHAGTDGTRSDSNAADEINLIAYLLAAHHGKVRLSVRSLPNDPRPSDPTQKFARGLFEGDEIPAVDLGNGETTKATVITLQTMGLGESESQGASWISRMLQLRDREHYGPFRLAYLEMLVRIADWRGSARGNN